MIRRARDGVTRESIEDEGRFFRDLVPAAGIDSEVALNVIRAGHFLLDGFAANFRTHGMSDAQFNVLVALEDAEDGRSMAEIARRMLISRAGVSGIVRGMTDKGWLRSRPCPGDARAVRVSLTPAGRLALERVLPSHLALVRALVGDGYTGREKQTLVRLLTRMRERLAARRTLRRRPEDVQGTTRRK